MAATASHEQRAQLHSRLISLQQLVLSQESSISCGSFVLLSPRPPAAS